MSDLAGLIAGYLRATGWTDAEPGKWVPKTTRRRSRKPPTSYYSLLAAVQRQMEIEFGAAARATRERYLPAEESGDV